MKLNDSLFILKRKLLKKDNIILGCVLIFLFLAIFACITSINFFICFRTSMLEAKDGNTLIIENTDDKEKLEEIENIEHVILVASKKYVDTTFVNVPQFDKDKTKYRKYMDSSITLKTFLTDNDAKIVKGSKLKNRGDMICPRKFYPYSVYIEEDVNSEFTTKFYDSLIINGDDLVGKSILATSDNKEYKFNVVGSFQNNVLEELDVCYISKEDFDMLRDDCEMYSNEECIKYNSLMVRVDNYSNVAEVEKKLQDLGFSPIRKYSYDEQTLSSMTAIPLFISSIIMVIVITIIYNFFRKKSINNQFDQGILKSLGYTKKDIISLNKLEVAIIYIITIIISFILYIIVYYFIVNAYLGEVTYSNMAVPIPMVYMLLFSLLLYGYTVLVIKTFTKKNLNMCVQKLFEE
ncbi:MAG: hypothetical protein OSJ70_01565 [Bacilli bacterium]|nr:hypothetical protein [Bacilli bacterium]